MYKQLRKSAKRFFPVFRLEKTWIFQNISWIKKVSLFLAALFFLLGTGIFGTDGSELFIGLVFFSIDIWIISVALHAFYLSVSLQDLKKQPKSGVSIDVASILFETSNDLTVDFVLSKTGQRVLERSGLDQKTVVAGFVQNRSKKLNPTETDMVFPEYVTLNDYVKFLYSHDNEFSEFLISHKTSLDDLVGSSEWVVFENLMKRRVQKWWSRENLAQIDSLGRDWAYGRAYAFERYAQPVIGSSAVYLPSSHFYYEDEVDQLEAILSRSTESNALIVGEEGIGKIDIIARLANKISRGFSLKSLSGKEMKVLDTVSLIASTGNKNAFESEFINILNQVQKSGNLILVIDDLTSFISSAKALGSDALEILDPYLSSHLQLIALSSNRKYQDFLSSNDIVMERFEIIQIKESASKTAINILRDRIFSLEMDHNVFFTYPAVRACVEGAERYFVGGVVLENAIDLIVEVIPKALQKKDRIIDEKDVLSLIEEKTSIPIVSRENPADRERLLNLEKIFHERIIGQDPAISGISDALRRSRSGISDPKRPIGSFLFLGPTGVGKTETTKALAHIFFGGEDKMMRLDMSEYNYEGALEKLIGSFDDEKSGVLTSMIRENPYGVLLLDEFEKTDSKVTDLFLQILDEGIFSDMHGRKVSAQNLIMVATSNAGSDLIWKLSNQGKDIVEEQDNIVNHIVEQKIFRPELLNRFDKVVVFHPLSQSQLEKISKIKLGSLGKRLLKEGIRLSYDDSLVKFLAEKGHDPKFGARALNRAIQDTVEKSIAEKIISQNLRQGDVLKLTASDLKT